jgi:hypothetical protein
MDSKKENLEFHAKGLISKFPDSECTITKDVLTWRGKLTPDYFSRAYDIEIVYKAFTRPIIRVSLIGMEIPVQKNEIHMYDDHDSSLCLFDNEKKEWKPNMALAKSIVPWTCEWLYFYEIWLITRRWLG